MNECSGLCDCPEDDTIFLSRRRTFSDVHFRLMRQHRAVDFLSTFAIMCLTGQPEGECGSPDPANKFQTIRNSRLLFLRSRTAISYV